MNRLQRINYSIAIVGYIQNDGIHDISSNTYQQTIASQRTCVAIHRIVPRHTFESLNENNIFISPVVSVVCN